MTDILRLIKRETQEWHSRIEKLIPVFADEFTLPAYRQLLQRFYGYYLPFEAEVQRLPALQRVLPDWPGRRKLPWLDADLAWLGCRPTELARLPLCNLLPRLDERAAVLGALYVTEGSTLGGQIICRRLSQSLQVQPSQGATFFHGHGDWTGPRWKIFTQTLSSMATPANETAMVQAAIDTFRTMWLWLAEEGVDAGAAGREEASAERSDRACL